MSRQDAAGAVELECEKSKSTPQPATPFVTQHAQNVGTSAGAVAQRVCQPVEKDGRRHRGLNPWAKEDAALLEVISRGEWAVAGFRNRDVRAAPLPLK